MPVHASVCASVYACVKWNRLWWGSSAFVDSCANENPFPAIDRNTGQEEGEGIYWRDVVDRRSEMREGGLGKKCPYCDHAGAKAVNF